MSIAPQNNDAEWYAVRTKPMEEDRAASNLAAWQVPVFAPKLKARRTSGYGSEYVSKPLFASYLFARFNADRQLHKINYTRGVHRVVSFGGRPIPIDERVINLIRERVAHDGFICRDEDLKPGDRVRINSGMFESLVGVFRQSTRDKERVKILLDAMKTQSHLLVARDLVEKVN
jgi:transcriptional antiterminator RfaH